MASQCRSIFVIHVALSNAALLQFSISRMSKIMSRTEDRPYRLLSLIFSDSTTALDKKKEVTENGNAPIVKVSEIVSKGTTKAREVIPKNRKCMTNHNDIFNNCLNDKCKEENVIGSMSIVQIFSTHNDDLN